MACGLAVKRPHEYDYETYLSPESAVETKRSRPSNQPNFSPFRTQLGTLDASLMQSSTSTSNENEEEHIGPLGVLKTTQLSGTQLEAYLTAEVQYLKRRKLIPSGAGHQNRVPFLHHHVIIADEVIVTRGHHKGNVGRVMRVYRKKFVVHVDNIAREKANGATVHIGLDSSNIAITKLNIVLSMNRKLQKW
ncbi:KOW motif domain-containing protein [Ditylenchus destructor]|uniref:KOW motif domain-containing protein n=1 Tax=Ditylenchus destructor TaxID=166010 RepID=A0AAD4R148_9BILA|nr:KOW motif domain-containing protein [Ditylenchus destructor]